MNVHFGLLVFYYDIDFMFFLALELKKKKKKGTPKGIHGAEYIIMDHNTGTGDYI